MKAKKDKNGKNEKNAKRGNVRLILVCGLPGTGKTTVAEELAKKTGSHILSTDIIRKELIRSPEYSDEEKDMVYGMLFSMAEMMLRDGRNVLIDGTFQKESLRKTAGGIASNTKSEFRIVEVVCDEAIIRKRLSGRCKTCSASDADFAVYLKIKKAFEPVRETHDVIDTGKPWMKQVETLAKKF
jgi:hypothetical protein